MVLSPGAGRTSAAGVLAFFAACPPCLCFAFLPPIPPTPFPGGEGGDFRLFYARGFAPCIPGAGRGAALGKGANHAPGGGRAPYRAGLGGHPVPGGGRARLVACLPCLWFTFLPPSPRPPSRREGGDFLFISPGATAPGTPAAEPIQRGFDLWKTVSLGYAKDLSLQ